MATAIGDLVARLRMDTKPFQRGAKTAMVSMRGLASAAGTVAAAGVAMGAALGLAGAAMAVRQLRREFEQIDKTAKLSDRIGIATEHLVGLQHAAEITGAGTETLNKGLMFMAKTLGELKSRGIGEAEYAMDALGMTIDDFSSKRPYDQVLLFADAFASLEDEATQSYVATKMFGRAGQGLVNTMRLGSDGLKQMQDDAELLRKTFSRTEAAQVEAANDAVYRLRGSVNALATQGAIQLAPFVAIFADDLTNAIVDVRGDAEGLTGEFGLMGTMVLGIVDAWHNATIAYARFSADVHEGLAGLMSGYDTGMGPAPGAPEWLANLGENLTDMKTYFEESADELNGVADALEKRDPVGYWVERARQLREELDRARGAANRFGTDGADALGGMENPFEKGEKTLAEWQSGLATVGMDARDKLIRELESTLPISRESGKAARDMLTNLRQADQALDRAELANQLNKQFADPFEMAEDRIRQIRDLMERGILRPGVGEKAFEDVFKGLEGPATQARFGGAIERGSAAAQRALYMGGASGRGSSMKIQSEQLKELRRIARGVENKPPEQTVSIPAA